MHFEKKGRLFSFNALGVTDFEKCGYFNGQKLLFENTLWESRYSGVPNTDEICTAVLLFYFSIYLIKTELENMFLDQI